MTALKPTQQEIDAYQKAIDSGKIPLLIARDSSEYLYVSREEFDTEKGTSKLEKESKTAFKKMDAANREFSRLMRTGKYVKWIAGGYKPNTAINHAIDGEKPEPGEPFIVEITGASKKSYWYADKIGRHYKVFKYPHYGHVQLVDKPNHSISDGDYKEMTVNNLIND